MQDPEECGKTSELLDVSRQLQNDPTKSFETAWKDHGSGLNDLVDALSRTHLWTSDDERTKAEIKTFKLLLAELSKASNDDAEKAIQALIRLLVEDTIVIQPLIDKDAFEILASYLSLQQDQKLRSQATILISKYLDAAPERGRGLLTTYVLSRLSSGQRGGPSNASEDLVLALSAASAMFPFVPKTASELFHVEGFMDDLILIGDGSKNRTIHRCVLELLSAACIDKACRATIMKTCSTWLASLVQQRRSLEDAALAGLVLSKISSESTSDSSEKQEELLFAFKDFVISGDKNARQVAIEGIAYLSTQPKVKDKLAKDKAFLQKLVGLLQEDSLPAPLMYGDLTIFSNLTAYLPNLTAEQARIAQLKSYANSSRPARPDPLDDDAHVTSRCKILLDYDLMSALTSLYRSATPGSLLLISSISLAISKHPKHRGKIAQQGGVKMSIDISSQDFKDNEQLQLIHRQCVCFLANLLIPLDPNLIFNDVNAQAAIIAVRQLQSLLTTPYLTDSGLNDLRPSMEAIRAITNLTTLNGALGSRVQDEVYRTCWNSIIEDKLIHHHEAVKRAAIQLVCNMSGQPEVRAYFANPDAKGATDIRHILALTQAEDQETALAAGGAVAGLSTDEGVTQNLLRWDKSPHVLRTLVESQSSAILERGLAIVGNLTITHDGRSALHKVGMTDALEEAIRRNGRDVVLCQSIEAIIQDCKAET